MVARGYLMKNVLAKFLKFIQHAMHDHDGTPSSKRVIAILFAVLIGAAFIANLGWNLTIDRPLLDAAMTIVIAGLGITSFEKFAGKNQSTKE